VELRGLEPLTSSMPWWPGVRRGRAASVDGVRGGAGAATSIRPGSPSVCPSPLERRPRRFGANISAWEDSPRASLGLSLGEALHRSSPSDHRCGRYGGRPVWGEVERRITSCKRAVDDLCGRCSTLAWCLWWPGGCCCSIFETSVGQLRGDGGEEVIEGGG
jgi:hypothetical protein